MRPHEPQHSRSPCPSSTPRVYPNSCPLSRSCHLTIASSVIPFSCLQSFPTSGSFQMSENNEKLFSKLFTSGGQILEFQLQYQSSPSPPALNISQHQGLFQRVSSSHEVAKVLYFQLQHQSFQWTPRTNLLQNGLVGSPCSPRNSQESSPTPQFKSIHSSVLSFLYSPALTSIQNYQKNHSLDWTDLCWQGNVSAF